MQCKGWSATYPTCSARTGEPRGLSESLGDGSRSSRRRAADESVSGSRGKKNGEVNSSTPGNQCVGRPALSPERRAARLSTPLVPGSRGAARSGTRLSAPDVGFHRWPPQESTTEGKHAGADGFRNCACRNGTGAPCHGLRRGASAGARGDHSLHARPTPAPTSPSVFGSSAAPSGTFSKSTRSRRR